MITRDWLDKYGSPRFYDFFDKWDFKTATFMIFFVDHDRVRICDTWQDMAECSAIISCRKKWYIVPKWRYAKAIFGRNHRNVQNVIADKSLDNR
jgi:hypothetical protein